MSWRVMAIAFSSPSRCGCKQPEKDLLEGVPSRLGIAHSQKKILFPFFCSQKNSFPLNNWSSNFINDGFCLSSTGCTLNGQEVRLTVHYENGFTVSKENGGSSSILYRYPFERLKMSADDGIRNLYLDFGGPEGELVRVSRKTILL